MRVAVSIRVDLTIANFSPVAAVLLALTSLAIVGFIDYLTGYEISFAVFYLVPVSIAAWYASRRWGLMLAFASSFVWYFAELGAGSPYHNLAIPIWNAFVRFLFFLIVVLLLSSLRGRLLVESRLAKTDALTGLLNSRAFLERLEHDLALVARTSSSLALAYVDLDDFKHVNDTHGHREGDRLLRTIAQKLVEGTRRSDTVGRLGGDEFALILPATDVEGAQSLMDKLARTLAGSRDDPYSVTCSIGAVIFRELPISADEAVAAADRLMYDAKRGGKNTLVVGIYSRSTLETDRTLQVAFEKPHAPQHSC